MIVEINDIFIFLSTILFFLHYGTSSSTMLNRTTERGISSSSQLLCESIQVLVVGF